MKSSGIGIVENRDQIETWFTLLDAQKTAELEKYLIRELKPRFNRIRYSTEKKREGPS